jgi:hypothetical protein
MDASDTASIAALTRLINEYAWGVDRRSWDSFAAIFDDTVAIDYQSFSGLKPVTVARDAYVPDVRSVISGFDVTQHQISNLRFTIAQDRAEATAYLVAYHFLGVGEAREKYVVGGFYDFQFARRAGHWKVTAIRLNVTWTEGDFTLFKRAKKRFLQSAG